MRYKRSFINVQEIWYDEERKLYPETDRVLYRFVKTKTKNASPTSTLLIDLTQTEEALTKSLKKDNRYQIRKSIKEDGLTYTMYDKDIDKETLDTFLKFFDTFSKDRGIDSIRIKDLEKYLHTSSLAISKITDKENNILAMHNYILVGKRVRAQLSLSNLNITDRGLIGRANRVLHWNDILFFKEHGYKVYDFGGWYTEKDDKKLLGVNQFKKSFGGEIEETFHYNQCKSLKCHLFTLLVNIKEKVLKK